MIKVIAFDLGGVLFAEGKSVALKIMKEKYGYNPDIILEILNSKNGKDLRRGLLSDEKFWSWAQKQFPEGYNAKTIKKEWYDGYYLNKDVYGLVKGLKKSEKYKIITFSGNIKSRIDYLEEKYNFRGLFDQEIYSFDCHKTKPDKEFFEELTKIPNVKLEEVVLIDDDENNGKIAAGLGVKCVIYKQGELENLKNDLNKLGIDI